MTINALNELSAGWVLLLWKASWQGGLALLLAVVVIRAVRRIPAYAQCWLYRLAFLKLLIAGIVMVSVELPVLPPVKTAAAVEMHSVATETPALRADVMSPVRQDLTVISGSQNVTLPQLSWWSWLLMAWIVGVIAGVVNLMRQWALVRRMVSRLPAVTDASLHQSVAENCRRMHLNCGPDLRVSDDSGSPCLIGLVRPVIVLPSVVLASCSKEALNAALLHELAHIKRRDLLWNWLPALAEVLFYFHPVVWLVRREWRLAQEIATDELAVSVARVDAARYASLLVELVAKCRATTLRPHLAVGVSETYSQLSRRMAAMLTFQESTMRRRLVMRVVVFAIAVCGIVPWKLTAREVRAQATSDAAGAQDDPQGKTPNAPADSRKAVLKTIEKLGGDVVFDERKPGRPVISVSLFSSKATDEDLASLKVLTDLRVLTLDATKVTDSGLSHLTGLSQLRALDLNSTGITDKGLAHLKGLMKLEQVGLIGTQVTDAGLVYLSDKTEMYMLNLGRTKITDQGLRHLTRLSNLKTLSIDGTQVTDAGLSHLQGLTNLRDLRLNETNISDAGLKHLQSLVHLETLILNATKVTGEGLGQLSGISSLQTLWIHSGQVTDQGAKQLAKLKSLTTLLLINNQLTDTGLTSLQELTQLETLYLDQNRKLTADGIKRLQAALPKCKIEWSPSAVPPDPKLVARQRETAAELEALMQQFGAAETFWQQGDVARKLIALGDTRAIARMDKFLEVTDRGRFCNAAMVAAGLGDKQRLGDLIAELEDKQPRPTERKRSDGKPDFESQITQDRYYAALLLGQLGKSEAVPALIAATEDPTIHYQAAISLGTIGDKRAIPALRKMVKAFPQDALWAGYGLARLGEQDGFDILSRVALSDPQWTKRRHAVDCLGNTGASNTVPTLTRALRDEHTNVRVSAAIALGKIGDQSALPALTEALKDTEKTQVNAPTTVAGEAQKAIEAINNKHK